MRYDKNRQTPELPYDASDPEQVEDAEQKAHELRWQELADMKMMVETPFSKRFLNRLFNKCKLYQPVMTGNSWTFYNDGGRNIALWIVKELQELAVRGELSAATLQDAILNSELIISSNLKE